MSGEKGITDTILDFNIRIKAYRCGVADTVKEGILYRFYAVKMILQNESKNGVTNDYL